MFDPNNDFWQWFSRFCDVFGLSLCWILCCIPILTIGPATTALYDAVYHGIRRRESGVYARFFRTFRQNLKVGIPVTVIGLVTAWVLAMAWYVTYQTALGGVTFAGYLLAVYFVLYSVPLGVWLMAQVLSSRFTFGLRGLLKTSFQLFFSQLPKAITATLAAFLLIRLTMWMGVTVMFTPGLWAFLSTPLYERIFAPYLPEEPEKIEE